MLKPNLLSADSPERCSTTHPSVFKAVAEVFMEAGINLTYGDSPGIHKPQTAAHKTGLEQAANELGISLADFTGGKEIFFEMGIQNKKFTLANGVLESDGIISIPKLKTHGLTRITGCIKNQFGCIPGALKENSMPAFLMPLTFQKCLWILMPVLNQDFCYGRYNGNGR